MDPLTQAGGIFLQLGVLGAIIVVEAIVIIALWRRGEAKDKKIEDLLVKIAEDSKQVTTSLKEPLEEQAKLSEKIYDFLLTSKRGRS